VSEVNAPFGPWVRGLDPRERAIELRTLAGLVYAYAGMICDPRPCMEALRLAENGQSADLAVALVEFDRLPALVRRKIISTFGRVTWPDKFDIKKPCPGLKTKIAS
jgi:hypothetical protein